MAYASTTIAVPARGERWAWGMCWLMFVSTVLCYMDRQTIALVRPAIRAEFGITNDQTFGWLLAAFYLPYALFQVPAGFLADSGDVRRIYALAVGGWSLAGIASAFSPSLGVLMACRVALGIGESFNWPCGLRLTSRILPPSDRSLGNGIFNSGAAVGAVLAPLTIPILADTYGWRAAFATIGVLGFAWVAVWLLVRPPGAAYSAPSVKPVEAGRLGGRARGAFAALGVASALIATSAYWFGPNAVWAGFAVLMLGALVVARVLPRSDLSGRGWSTSLATIVRRRRFWVMVVVSVSINVCWHFLVNWMADFFQTGRNLGMVGGATLSAIPFLAADAGNLFGGGLSGWMTRRGMGVFSARLAVMAVGAAMVACGSLTGLIRNNGVVVVVLSIMALGAASIMANYFALCQDVEPRSTGLVVGILGGLGNLFAAGFMPIAGYLKDITKGPGLNFAIVGLLPIIGLIALGLGWGRGPEGAEPAWTDRA